MSDDVQAIKNLSYSYAELLDAGDLERAGFTDRVIYTDLAGDLRFHIKGSPQ